MPTVKRSSSEVDLSGFDWSKVDATTPDDIARQITDDPDTAPDLSAVASAEARRIHPPASPARLRRGAR